MEIKRRNLVDDKNDTKIEWTKWQISSSNINEKEVKSLCNYMLVKQLESHHKKLIASMKIAFNHFSSISKVRHYIERTVSSYH